MTFRFLMIITFSLTASSLIGYQLAGIFKSFNMFCNKVRKTR
ncbi:hypothetical protein Q8G37_26395 [Bacillus wiedmannii]|nr:hypothetical protein [Bacillus wiedmannii]MDP1459915.1 hypothetical protein [Bacillus wiedmannii]